MVEGVTDKSGRDAHRNPSKNETPKLEFCDEEAVENDHCEKSTENRGNHALPVFGSIGRFPPSDSNELAGGANLITDGFIADKGLALLRPTKGVGTILECPFVRRAFQ